ncbi:N-(5'-phosphoribosyl)anthranilate isomerase [Litorisediminicola beolgyonensis]|uniref:N-(5'-phosphoribosyl)anthranilate isomerase n=1 Tax=Litorisediminicola beolgyonensis TaxID=1173614 RepID=A0ABW3ZM00_9RHOB
MRLDRKAILSPCQTQWLDQVFSARAVAKGGVVRRAVRDTERMVGRAILASEVRRCGFHMVECGGQFIVICNDGEVQIVV